jgi:hypothetical protein
MGRPNLGWLSIRGILDSLLFFFGAFVAAIVWDLVTSARSSPASLGNEPFIEEPAGHRLRETDG